jgi:hypothetical protein
MADDALARRLEALASFAVRLKDARVPFGIWRPAIGSGATEDPLTLPWFSLSELGNDFVLMVYETGWMLKDFDWASWVHSRHGQQIANDRTVLVNASAEQLAKLLTALIRQDRFVEGVLSKAYESGLLLAITERAQALERKL